MNCQACPAPSLQASDRHHLCALVDVAIFTILEVEERAVLWFLKLEDLGVHWLSTGTAFKYGTFVNDAGSKVRIAVFRAGHSGNGPMASLASFAHASLLPRLSLLAGICAGLKSADAGAAFKRPIKGLRVGTVVMPREVIDYSHAIVSAGSELGVPEYIPAHRVHMLKGIGLSLKTGCNEEERTIMIDGRNHYMRLHENKSWTGRADERSFPTPKGTAMESWKSTVLPQQVLDPEDFVVSDNDIASSNLLLKNERELQNLHVNRHGRVMAADMESAGFAVACEAARAEWSVVRGVSDLGDTAKSDQFQPYAAANAAAYLRHALGKLDINLLRNTAADILNRMRLREAQVSVASVLEAFASIFHDHLGRRVNLEIYWIGRGTYNMNGTSIILEGVVRDGSMKAERSGALNRFEPNRFFPFEPPDGNSRAVARAGAPGTGPEHYVFHPIDPAESTPLKWVYAVPLYSERNLQGQRVGVLCCTSTESLTDGDASPEQAAQAKIALRALIGGVRDVVTNTCINTDVWGLVRRDVDYR